MTSYEELFRESIGNITVIGCINDTEGDEPLFCSVDVYEDGPCSADLISSEDCLEKDLEELFQRTVGQIEYGAACDKLYMGE